MKRIFFGLTILLVLAGCGRLDQIPYDPAYSPAQWLSIQPYSLLRLGAQDVYLMQPSTTAIVYLLGLLTIWIGLIFLRRRQGQQSRLWWGIALLLWGLGALLAGTSYEAFSYAIKCAGWDVCRWTSWWEIAYLLCTVWSIDAILLAVAYSSTRGAGRRLLTGYAVLNALAYLVLLLAGVFIPVKFWISFEMLIVVGLPGFLILFLINGWRALKYRDQLDRALAGIWLWLALTIAAYFGYYLSGLTNRLWAAGWWFSENDVLHIFLIAWMLFIARLVVPRTRDLPDNE